MNFCIERKNINEFELTVDIVEKQMNKKKRYYLIWVKEKKTKE